MSQYFATHARRKVNVGNIDWNVYCISEYTTLSSNIIVLSDNSTVVLWESITGSGRPVPGMPNVSILPSFVRPDKTVDTLPVKASEKGIQLPKSLIYCR
jgi:hypothetical protein